ncbi:biotin--[acetyl-CoA-carboxylase] ligase [Fastidiosibacter lacustris]|uniref:biotin--[acetyl-CoA-carboxylase] ligase n=1 Tax=Fastidiosibacter lacustris TaxID=2056695 RepID=UPI000E34E824|nr:biotin--[acetyl-CoA-carboxylase] ligase [Fastidiosibacter lacustris]
MNITLLNILKQLNCENYTDGTTIGNKLNITRAAVWKNIQKLQDEYHIAIESNKAHGYKLIQPLILLDQKRILEHIQHSNVQLDCLVSVDSTNDYLQNNESICPYHICLAEYQKKGKGRFNRTWISPFAENLYFSLKTTLAKEIGELSGLSLALAVCVAKVLSSLFTELDIKIKWPNDIYLNEKKLSGILVEVKAESNAQSQIIIGIGINVNMSFNLNISQPWVSLQEVLGQYVDRNILAINLANDVIITLKKFEASGFISFIENYHHFDYLTDKEITLSLPNNMFVTGIAQGVNELGQLQLCCDQKQIKTFASGEASIVKK